MFLPGPVWATPQPWHPGLAPPLTVSFAEIDRLMGGLTEVIAEVVG